MAHAYESSGRQRRNGVARGALKSRADDVLEDIVELRKDVGKLADAAGKAARAEVSMTGERIEKLGRTLRSRANESAKYLRERADDGVGYVSDQVRERPGAAIGLSIGVGMLIGFALRNAASRH